MMVLSKPLGILLCSAAGILSSGCYISETTETGPTVSVPRGYLTLRWTIENSNSPAMCRLYGASDLELLIYDRNQRQIAATYARCEDFEVTVELREGAYSANATLVTSTASAVSTTLPIAGIRITSGEALVIRADFPAESRR